MSANLDIFRKRLKKEHRNILRQLLPQLKCELGS
jgi:hypothetical protein